MDKNSSAYNKGRVFIHGAGEITANAYRKQFRADLAGFLSSRSVELKRGGSMFLVCLGRTSVDPTDQGGAGLLFGTHFQDAWDDLVREVIIILTTFLCVLVWPNSAQCTSAPHSLTHLSLADQKGLLDTLGEMKRKKVKNINNQLL